MIVGGGKFRKVVWAIRVCSSLRNLLLKRRISITLIRASITAFGFYGLFMVVYEP